MSTVVYIGVDDTDVPGSPGTGRVARGLAKLLEEKSLATSLGVSRHQLLINPHIKYTSHNSAKGIAVKTDKSVTELYQPCVSYLEGCFVAGADPGLCISPQNKIDNSILMFGKMAANDIMNKQDAISLAKEKGIFLKEVGGTGDGIIGALAAVGLRAGGNDGRLVDLRGIRDVTGVLTVAELKKRTDIDLFQDGQGNTLGDNEIIDTLDRVRPSLVNGKAVLLVRYVTGPTGKKAWQPFGTAHKKGKGENSDEEHD
jgi:hypothetical protein